MGHDRVSTGEYRPGESDHTDCTDEISNERPCSQLGTHCLSEDPELHDISCPSVGSTCYHHQQGTVYDEGAEIKWVYTGLHHSTSTILVAPSTPSDSLPAWVKGTGSSSSGNGCRRMMWKIR